MVEINSHGPSTAVAVEAVGNDDEGDWSRDDDGVAVTEPMQTETETITPAAQGMIDCRSLFSKELCSIFPTEICWNCILNICSVSVSVSFQMKLT